MEAQLGRYLTPFWLVLWHRAASVNTRETRPTIRAAVAIVVNNIMWSESLVMWLFTGVTRGASYDDVRSGIMLLSLWSFMALHQLVKIVIVCLFVFCCFFLQWIVQFPVNVHVYQRKRRNKHAAGTRTLRQRLTTSFLRLWCWLRVPRVLVLWQPKQYSALASFCSSWNNYGTLYVLSCVCVCVCVCVCSIAYSHVCVCVCGRERERERERERHTHTHTHTHSQRQTQTIAWCEYCKLLNDCLGQWTLQKLV